MLLMRYILAGLLILALGPLARVAYAKPAAIVGAWVGDGSVRLKSGQVEKVRCRLSYQKDTGRTYILSATCSTTNGIFKQSGRVVQLKRNTYSGRLYSTQYSVSGRVTISISGRRQTLSVSSEKGSGRLILRKR